MLFPAQDLCQSYGDFELSIPDLTVESGTSIGCVGDDGAGNTTLLRLVLDLIKADYGRM